MKKNSLWKKKREVKGRQRSKRERANKGHCWETEKRLQKQEKKTRDCRI